jgi:hypothetical protein
MLVAAEAIQRERRQLCQAQEAVTDFLFRIETEFLSRRRVRLQCRFQVQLISVGEIGWLDEGQA